MGQPETNTKSEKIEISDVYLRESGEREREIGGGVGRLMVCGGGGGGAGGG